MHIRLLAALAGIALIAAMTHGGIIKSGGYHTAEAAQIMALSFGLIAGAAALGYTWSSKNRGLAITVALCLLAGEAVSGYRTLKDALATSASAAEPEKQAVAEWNEAVKEKERAQRQVDAANAALNAKASEKTCAANCADLLKLQKAAADKDYSTASNALARLQRPRTTLTVATAFNLDPIRVELFAALAMSIALNGLGAGLFAVATHSHQRRVPTHPKIFDEKPDRELEHRAFVTTALPDQLAAHREPARTPVQITRLPQQPPRKIAAPTTTTELQQPAPVTSRPPTTSRPLEPAAKIEVDDFAVETILPNPRGSASVIDIFNAYVDWCRHRQINPLEAGDFAEVLATLCKNVGLKPITGKNGIAIKGVKIVSAPLRIAKAS